MGAARGKFSFNGVGVVQGGPCIVESMKYINEDSATRFMQIFDAKDGSNITLGTTIPLRVMVAATNGSDEMFFKEGFKLDNGLVVIPSTTATGSVSPALATQHFMVSLG